MSSINMSLEEIIGKNKKSKSGRLIGGFRSDGVSKSSTGKSGGARNFGRFSDRTPAGKWKHDKFQDETRAFRARGGAIAKVIAGSSNPNKKVRVNLSNLGPNVVSADLEELFGPYNIDTATVHFNEQGISLGTGDVYLKRKDALQMFEDFKGVSLDGKLIKMLIVDGGEGVANGIESRLSKLPRQSTRGIQKTFRRTSGGVSNSFLDRIVDDKPRRGGMRRRSLPGRERKSVKSVAELDAELESYMNKGRPVDL